MKVSVITVCYNASNTIGKTIESVIHQTYRDIEYIIIDGNSIDGTQKLIERYKDCIAFFSSEPDKNIYDAMNKGIRAATGELIFFLNADDYFENPAIIEKIVDEYRVHPTDIIFGDVYLVDQLTNERVLKKHNDFDKIFLKKHCICQQAIFYAKAAFDKYGCFDDRFLIVADLEWLLRASVSSNFSFTYVALPISVFTMGGISNNEKMRDKHLAERKLVERKYFNRAERLLYHSDIISLLNKYKLLKKMVLKFLSNQ